MDAVQRLQAAVGSRLVDEDGHEVAIELRPPVPEAEVATLQAGYPVPLPAELLRLLAVTRGAGALLDLDLTGRDHSVELAELMPAGLPIAADGFGNFWVLDLTPDTAEVAPVFFHCHDAGQQVLVPEVDAVEVADRHDGPRDVVEPNLVE